MNVNNLILHELLFCNLHKMRTMAKNKNAPDNPQLKPKFCYLMIKEISIG